MAGIYPAEIRAINLDADWFYRKGGRLFFLFMDKGLNGLNHWCDLIFVKGIAGWICRLSKDVVARGALLVMVSFWIAIGLRDERLSIRKSNLYADIMEGNWPAGISAGVAVAAIFLVFMMV